MNTLHIVFVTCTYVISTTDVQFYVVWSCLEVSNVWLSCYVQELEILIRSMNVTNWPFFLSFVHLSFVHSAFSSFYAPILSHPSTLPSLSGHASPRVFAECTWVTLLLGQQKVDSPAPPTAHLTHLISFTRPNSPCSGLPDLVRYQVTSTDRHTASHKHKYNTRRVTCHPHSHWH